MKPKIFLLSLGCPRNLVDSEVLMGLFKKRGFLLTDNPESANFLIVNTCAFIEDAKKESIDVILEMIALKKKSDNSKKIIVIGCLSQRYAGAIKKEFPEIEGIFGSSDFVKVPEFIDKSKDERMLSVNKTPDYLYSHEENRVFITPPHYVYVKLQEGCMNNCSYCTIPKLRGPYRSRSMDSVIKEVRSFSNKGIVKELNLIGQDTTLYGIDRYGKRRLKELLKVISGIFKDNWIRLLYTHPAHYDDELIDVIAGEAAICKYLDLPIQHINDRILKDMNRRVTKKDVLFLIEKLRKKIPDVAIRTTVMVGFPKETDKEFKELLDFLRDIKFERLGAFIYSKEEGTPAYKFKEEIPEKSKDERFKELLEVQEEISKKINEKFLGRTFKVLLDEMTDKGHTRALARTYMDAPEVDGACYVKSNKKLKIGSFLNVKITDTLEYDLVGDAV